MIHRFTIGACGNRRCAYLCRAGDDGQHAYTAPPEHGRFHSAAYESDIKLSELVILCTRYMPSVNSSVDWSRRLLQPLYGRYASWFRDKILRKAGVVQW
jgi:hypothetical protein